MRAATALPRLPRYCRRRLQDRHAPEEALREVGRRWELRTECSCRISNFQSLGCDQAQLRFLQAVAHLWAFAPGIDPHFAIPATRWGASAGSRAVNGPTCGRLPRQPTHRSNAPSGENLARILFPRSRLIPAVVIANKGESRSQDRAENKRRCLLQTVFAQGLGRYRWWLKPRCDIREIYDVTRRPNC